MTSTTISRLPAVPTDVPGASLHSYINSVQSIPTLTREREHELSTAYYQHQDLQAARELTMAHLKFVVYVTRGYLGYGLPQADLIQEGNIGLMKAIKRFDPGVGVRLASFAIHWIKAEIHEFIIRNWRIVKVATTKAQRKLFFNLRSRKKTLNRMNSDEIETIAEELNVSPGDVREMETRLYAQDAPLESNDSDDENSTAPIHYLKSNEADMAQTLEQEEWQDIQLSKLQSSLTELDDRSLDILSRRWLSEKKVGLRDLAEEYGISAERVRQIEQAAIKKLRAHMQVVPA